MIPAPFSLREAFATWLIARVTRRAPDKVIGGEGDPYLRRWFLVPRNRWCNIYLHHFMRSDDDRALHDHPWWNASWLLRGAYDEILFAVPPMQKPPRLYRVERRVAGDLVSRRAQVAHRVRLLRGTDGREEPVWTLFLTGPRLRDWGFWCPQGWRHWREFTDPKDSGKIGRGCE